MPVNSYEQTSSLSGTESTSHPRGVASRLVTAATGSGATRVAAAAAMMWLLRLRVSAGGSLQLRGGETFPKRRVEFDCLRATYKSQIWCEPSTVKNNARVATASNMPRMAVEY